MKKKLLSAVFAAMLAVGSLAGCGKKASEAGTDKTKIEFWTIDLKANFEDYFKTMIANYEKENPDVEVNWTDIPYADMQSSSSSWWNGTRCSKSQYTICINTSW